MVFDCRRRLCLRFTLRILLPLAAEAIARLDVGLVQRQSFAADFLICKLASMSKFKILTCKLKSLPFL